MPPPKTTQSSQTEGRIALAIEALKQGHFTSVRGAAKAYDVPESTLRYRIHKHPARRDSRPINCKLTDIEESTLVQWILSMDQRGLSPRSDTVRQMANLLLQKRSDSSQDNHPTVGKLWVHNFVRRHTALKSRYNRKYDYQRAKCEDPAIIREWFCLVRNTIAKYGIIDEDIYNFDETGFQMGVISTAKVITGAERSNRPVSIQPGNREWVTAIDCISSYGWSLPPVIIFEGKVHQSTWYTKALPLDWVIGVSENGWTDDKLGLTWLQNVFEKHTAHRTKGVYRLLIIDGHGSHVTPEFDLFCKEHSIITLCMPPHSSHLLQPLDVGCFSVLKRSYGRQIEGYMRNGVNHIDKQDFLEAYYAARTETMNLANIHSSFTATGLVPYDPERVLSRLHTQLKTPTPPPAMAIEQGPWVPETPYNTAQLELQSKAIKDYIKRRTKSPPSPTDVALNQLVKGCQMAMNNAVLLAEENRQLRAENERQKKKRAKRRSYIATGGVLTVQEGLDLSQKANTGLESGVAYQEATVQTRAPRTCSLCRSQSHTARTCLTKQVSN
jgi:DDE superfamily endonuclease/Tc5 transposase DNA-binding domain/helix-turn-helix, Psq domain